MRFRKCECGNERPRGEEMCLQCQKIEDEGSRMHFPKVKHIPIPRITKKEKERRTLDHKTCLNCGKKFNRKECETDEVWMLRAHCSVKCNMGRPKNKGVK